MFDFLVSFALMMMSYAGGLTVCLAIIAVVVMIIHVLRKYWSVEERKKTS